MTNASSGVHVNSIDAVAGAARSVSTAASTEAGLDYKSLNSILDDNLRPLPPIPGNSRSEQIHDEHKKLVQEYWEIQTQIVTSQALRDNLQANMPAEELRLKKEYLKKLEEKEALIKFKATLQQQLDERRRLACSAQVHTSPAVRIQQNQNQQSVPPPVAGSPNRPQVQRQDSATDSTWVLVNRTELDQAAEQGAGGNNPSWKFARVPKCSENSELVIYTVNTTSNVLPCCSIVMLFEKTSAKKEDGILFSIRFETNLVMLNIM